MKFEIDLESIKYIKIVYKDKDDINHCVKASVKSLDERNIYACAKSEVPLFVKTPQDVSLSIICENGLYSTNTTLKYTENKDEFVFFTLKMQDEFRFQQNREYFRVSMDGDVWVKFNQQSIQTKIYDISANGIRVIMEKTFEFPEDVTLDMLISSKSIKTKAKYIRTDDEDNILKASFNFVDISDFNRDLISQKCIQKQLEDKRNSLG